ncbi:MAG: hypothetical protein ACE5HV_00180 [Acidobacteriota bacterium]
MTRFIRRQPKIIFPVGFLLYRPPPLVLAPTFVRVAVDSGDGVTQIDLSIDIDGADRCLIASLSSDVTGTTTVTFDPAGPDEKTGTLIGSTNFGGATQSDLFHVVGPVTGLGKTVRIATTTEIVGAVTARLYTGVDQTTPVGTAATASGESFTPSVTVTSATGELVVDNVCHAGGGAGTPDATQTERYDNIDVVDGSALGSDKAGAASVDMGWTIGEVAWATVGASLKPAAVADELIQSRRAVIQP